MPSDRALLTESEREVLLDGDGETERDDVRETVHRRLDELERDLDILADHEPTLFEQVQAAVDRTSLGRGEGDDGAETLGESDFPEESEKSKAAVYVTRDFIRANEEVSRAEIIRTIMPMYPLTYDVSDARRSETDAGDSAEWFEEVIEPGLDSLSEVEPAPDADDVWRYSG
jgi:hypothetical protein